MNTPASKSETPEKQAPASTHISDAELERLHEDGAVPAAIHVSSTVHYRAAYIFSERAGTLDRAEDFAILTQNLASYVYGENYRKICADIKSESDEGKRQKLWNELFYGTVASIGWAVDKTGIPLEDYLMLTKWTREVIGAIREADGRFEVSTNGYVVPGSLTGIGILIENGVLDPKHVDISCSEVNIQEGVAITKSAKNGHPNATEFFSPGIDTIDELSLKFGKGTSVAHGATFYASGYENEYRVVISTGEWVFIGINSLVGSGTTMWDYAVIGWNARIGEHCCIGENTIVGIGATIDQGVHLGENILVQNGAHIKAGYETIPFDEYIRRSAEYRTKKADESGRPNFVIALSIHETEREEQLEKIRPTYLAAKNFNRNHVTPENKVFSALDSVLSLILEKIGNDGKVIQERSFESRVDGKVFHSDFGGKIEMIGIEKAKNAPTKVSVKAYPKNPEDFILRVVPELLDAIEQGNSSIDGKGLKEILIENLNFPNIPEDSEKTFLGHCALTGNIRVEEGAILYKTNIRSDEQLDDTACHIGSNARLGKTTIHGPGAKNINHITALNTVLHGHVEAAWADIGDPKHATVLNNVIIEWDPDDRIQIAGSVTMNNAHLSGKTKIGHGVIVSANKDTPTTIEDSEIAENVSIGDNVRLKNVTIVCPGYKIPSDTILENVWIGPHTIIWKDGIPSDQVKIVIGTAQKEA